MKTSKPILPDEVPDGKCVVQIMFNHGGQLFAANLMGDSMDIVTDSVLRSKIMWHMLAAAASQIAAVNGVVAEIEEEPNWNDLLAREAEFLHKPMPEIVRAITAMGKKTN